MTTYLLHWIAANPTAVVAAVSAVFAIRTYRQTYKTKRAEFLLQLHKSFFVDPTYKDMRDLLDESGDDASVRLHDAISDESSELTDFLNLFELIAYFENRGTLRREDIEALLGYYLDLMGKRPELLRYVGKDDRSFENLNALLKKHKKAKSRKGK